jgi:ribonucleoside-diphosphate reductase alpha chain
MKTSEIHSLLIKAASDLISEDTPNYDHVAARLVWFAVRKEAFGTNMPPHLRIVLNRNIESGFYSGDVLQYYNDEEIDELNSMLDHRRDDLFRYAGAEQMRKKYLVQNRKTRKIYESFQFPYIMVAATLFARYPKETRMMWVKKFYDLASQHYISLPTPIMAGMRTPVKQFSSCTVIDSGDSLLSINSTASAIVEYASKKAGIGINVGRIRGVGQLVNKGTAVTTGVIPFAKYFNAALKSCSQGSVRGASATVSYPGWHIEFESLIELKNNKGTEETRIRTMDYSVALNGFMYERLVTGGNITLFSPEEVPDLYDAFYSNDTELFKTLYEKYETSPKITRKSIPAMEYFSKLMNERFETGRIYIFNADNVNKQTPFYENIFLSNLCQEICLPTAPMGNDESLIALCTLAAVNVGKFSKEMTESQIDILRDCCQVLNRGLDELLSYQDYMNDAARRHTERYRPLGIGIIGYAHWLAKGRMTWGSDEALLETDKLMERIAYYLTESSISLAEERGSIDVHTRYHEGIFPKDVSVVPVQTRMDWDALKTRALKYGIRNATLMALMPCETSSQLSNETSGFEPPRSLITIKGSKEGVLPQVVPEFSKLNNVYETLWNIDVRDYLKTVAVMQHWVDQSISANTSYSPSRCEITMSRLISDLLFAYQSGVKTLYYSNTYDGSGDDMLEDGGCESGACKL